MTRDEFISERTRIEHAINALKDELAIKKNEFVTSYSRYDYFTRLRRLRDDVIYGVDSMEFYPYSNDILYILKPLVKDGSRIKKNGQSVLIFGNNDAKHDLFEVIST